MPFLYAVVCRCLHSGLKALNVVVRMEPTSKFSFNVRSFFPPGEIQDIGNGIILCRGYFQSVRPAVGKMLVNVDISTAMMYKPGRLIDVCLEFFGRPGDPNILSTRRRLPERERLRLRSFLTGMKVVVTTGGGQSKLPRAIKSLSREGARDTTFQMRDGGASTIADYFQNTHNYALQFPDLLCVEVRGFSPL